MEGTSSVGRNERTASTRRAATLWTSYFARPSSRRTRKVNRGADRNRHQPGKRYPRPVGNSFPTVICAPIAHRSAGLSLADRITSSPTMHFLRRRRQRRGGKRPVVRILRRSYHSESVTPSVSRDERRAFGARASHHPAIGWTNFRCPAGCSPCLGTARRKVSAGCADSPGCVSKIPTNSTRYQSSPACRPRPWCRSRVPPPRFQTPRSCRRRS
jgi:hypothetical protein